MEEDWGRSKWLQDREKRCFMFFAFFTPLYRRFRPSGVLQTVDLEEIYRFLSKILDFMPCGSVFGHFCVLCTNLMAWVSKIYRKSIENLSKIYRKSIEHLSKIYRKSIENLSKIYVSEEYLRCIWSENRGKGGRGHQI